MRPCGVYNTRYEQEIAIVRTAWQWFLLIACLLASFLIPYFLLGGHILSVLIVIGITIIVMQGLNILLGYCGQISLGQVAFMAVGAYSSGILAERFHFPFLAALISSGIITALFGLIFGLPSLRVKGFYLAITTLAAHFIIIWGITHGGSLTREIYGITLPTPSIAGWTLDTDKEFYIFTVALVWIMTMMAKNIVRTNIGRAFVAIRDNDIAAEVMGINVFRYKLLAFFICSFYAGIGGSLWAYYTLSIHPEQFPLMDSIWYLGFLVVGGMGSIMGPVFGSIVWRGLKEGVSSLVPVFSQIFPGFSANLYSGLSLIIYALVIILFLIYEPRGINHRWTIFKAYYRLWPFSY